MEADTPPPVSVGKPGTPVGGVSDDVSGGKGGTAWGTGGATTSSPAKPLSRRFHGTVRLDPTRVGRDAARIAEEVIAHLAGQVGAEVTVTLEIEAVLPNGAPDRIIRVVTENSRVLKFEGHEFENE